MSEPVVPMLSGTGQVSTWTGKDPADRQAGEAFDDAITHEPLAGRGGVSTWSGADPALREDAHTSPEPAPVQQQGPPTGQPADDGPPADPPADAPTE